MAELHAWEQVEDPAREKAEFCLATGVQPSEYDNLTDTERAAFIAELNKRTER